VIRYHVTKWNCLHLNEITCVFGCTQAHACVNMCTHLFDLQWNLICCLFTFMECYNIITKIIITLKLLYQKFIWYCIIFTISPFLQIENIHLNLKLSKGHKAKGDVRLSLDWDSCHHITQSSVVSWKHCLCLCHSTSHSLPLN
jgi:hypothetical protein